MENVELQISELKEQLNGLEIQMTMMDPASIIEFRGEVLSTIKNIIKSMDQLELEIKKNYEEHKSMIEKRETVLKEVDRRIDALDKVINDIKVKAALAAAGISALVTLLGHFIVRKLFGE